MALKIDKRTLAPNSPSALDTHAGSATVAGTEATRAASTAKPPAERDAATKQVSAHVDYARLMTKLTTGDRSPKSLNALGVCHLRLGNYSEAVRIFRSITLQAGCTWERQDVPPLYRRNFATALLLDGLPAGCLAVLQSPDLADHPRSREIFASIKRWERSLPFFKRWDWRLNGVAPKDCHIPIDFEPGEFEA